MSGVEFLTDFCIPGFGRVAQLAQAIFQVSSGVCMQASRCGPIGAGSPGCPHTAISSTALSSRCQHLLLRYLPETRFPRRHSSMYHGAPILQIRLVLSCHHVSRVAHGRLSNYLVEYVRYR